MYKRQVHARIDALAEKLTEMEKRRGESRKARAKTGMPVVSLVGYTNVGKSSLMNALCGPSVAEADMLFATLDPTSRKPVSYTHLDVYKRQSHGCSSSSSYSSW